MNEKTVLDGDKVMEVISRLPHEKTLKSILKDLGISPTSFFNFLLEHPDADRKYSIAQSARAELLADEIIDIADTEADPQRARNRIDARKWVSSKLKPNKFGDRIDVNVNHTVDISEALKDARARTNLLPTRHVIVTPISQPIDITPSVNEVATDTKSVEQPNPLISFDDLFS